MRLLTQPIRVIRLEMPNSPKQPTTHSNWDGGNDRRTKNFLAYMSESEIDSFLEGIVERGAERALSRIGLGDENAGRDIEQIRAFIGGWRIAKHSALTHFAKIAMWVLFIAFASLFIKNPEKLIEMFKG